MGRETLENKLDQITIEDLGVSIDSVQMWGQLNARLNRGVSAKRLLLAACIMLLILLVPFSLLEPVELKVPIAEVESATGPLTPEHTQEKAAVPEIIFGGDVPALLNGQRNMKVKIEVLDKPIRLANFTQIPIQRQESKDIKFHNKDISVIQASLGKRKTETGRKVTVRAQLYPSSDDSEIGYQQLKIKLNGKN